ncbi:MAG TPA: ATP-binding protein [Candidatus Omnitrophota bacterium]|nr:PAS domain-containing protein [Candidatus Omnitrophota bacterium]MDD5736830.1 ATP-binding protein [Candidatus Omnitrophota bacterium]HOX09227.1 ATP-binding protein [Candidatus Omnitrophota bacterium]HPN66135.1 ATP-binding protein [Candidatus Omnitrophota bacterium]
MNIRSKLTLLFLFIILAVAASIALERSFEVKRLADIFTSSRAREEITFDKIVAIRNSRLEALVEDYTFWDEMVEFTRTGDRGWAKENIDASLPIFDVNAMWVYSRDCSLIYSSGGPKGPAAELPVSGEDIPSLFKDSKLCHFFIRAEKGLIEVRGATIHPTADWDRKTEPRGYLFAGILWDEKFLREMASLTGTEVRFASLHEKPAPDTSANVMAGEARFLRDLWGWDGKPLAKIAVSFKSESIRHYNLMGQTIFFIFGLLSALSLIVLFVSVVRLVSIPLQIVSESLKRKDPALLVPLENKKDEFGGIAKVIRESFEQAAELEAANVRRRKAEIQGEAILENIADLAWLKDLDNRYIVVNGPFAKACGREPAGLVGKTDYDVWPKELAEKHTADDREVMLSGKQKIVCEPLFSIDGNMLWMETVKTPMFNDKGEVIGIAGISRDITERRKDEEALKKAYIDLKETQHRLIQAEKFSALGKFSTSFAHEIKNPLGIILNGIEFLEMKLGSSDNDVKEDLDIIKRSTLRADSIIKRLLKFARPSGIKLEKINPRDLVNDTLPFFKYSSPSGEIKIKTEISPEHMAFTADKNQIQQAIINLVMNAAEAMSRTGGEITIKAYKEDSSEFYFAKPVCVIEISDNGPGISEENMTKLFEPFFTTKLERGTGLGLFITKLIIDNNKGNISMDSKLGRGTVVRMIFPLA